MLTKLFIFNFVHLYFQSKKTNKAYDGPYHTDCCPKISLLKNQHERKNRHDNRSSNPQKNQHFHFFSTFTTHIIMISS